MSRWTGKEAGWGAASILVGAGLVYLFLRAFGQPMGVEMVGVFVVVSAILWCVGRLFDKR